MAYPTTVSIVGNAFMAVAFLIMGPVPFINLEPTVPLIQVNNNFFFIGILSDVYSFLERY